MYRRRGAFFLLRMSAACLYPHLNSFMWEVRASCAHVPISWPGSIAGYSGRLSEAKLGRDRTFSGRKCNVRVSLVSMAYGSWKVWRLMLQDIQPVFKFSTLIIVEPLLSPQGRHHLYELRQLLVDRAQKRRECWPNRDLVRKAFTNPDRRPLAWEDRVLTLFIVRQLLPSGCPIDLSHTGAWLLWCSREELHCPLLQSPTRNCLSRLLLSLFIHWSADYWCQAMYMDEEGPTKPVESLNNICLSVPVHLILGARKDFM